MLVASFFAVAVVVAAAPADDRGPPPPPAPLPASETGGVPLNPFIVVADPANDVRLQADGGVDVAFDLDGLAGADFAPLLRVAPRAPLSPLTHHRLIAVVVDENGFAEETAELTAFTTGDAVDDAAPVVDVSFDDPVLVVEGDDDVVAVDVRQDGGPSQLLVLQDGRVSLTSLSGRPDVAVTVVAFDAAGNAADAVDLDVTFEQPPCCKRDVETFCGAAPASTASLWALLLALVKIRGSAATNFRRWRRATVGGTPR